MLVEFELSLFVGVEIVLFFAEEFVEAEKLLTGEGELILIIVDNVLVIPEFHDSYLVFLVLLPIFFDLTITVV